ncbi:MAG: substrate-binding domain-containing protein [Fibrobacteres bacterium]|nr:substrate-binding domain-containing protein [Fibrobacterota bacterium]
MSSHVLCCFGEVRSIDKSSRIARQILEEIQSGLLRPGSIVGIGEDAAALRNASAPTLRKVIRRLIAQGALEALPRGGRVPFPKRLERNRIALIRRCDARGKTIHEAERPRRFRRELELQALRMNLSLEIVGYAGEDRFFATDGKLGDWKSVSANKLGMVFSLWDVREDAWLLERAVDSELPTAVWDERPQGGMIFPSPKLRYFETSYSLDAGRNVARHAVESGRTRIAWISPFQGAHWSNARLQGIQEGLDGRAKLVCQAVESQFPLHREPEVESSDFWFDANRMRSHLGAPLEPGIDDIVRRLGILLARRTLCQRLSSLFEDALSSQADAWILANDEVAHLAWDWLLRKGKDVPRDIALAGFDDASHSQERGLTSIHFDEERLAAACLRHLTGPREGSKGDVVQIPPLLMVRRSMR